MLLLAIVGRCGCIGTRSSSSSFLALPLGTAAAILDAASVAAPAPLLVIGTVVVTVVVVDPGPGGDRADAEPDETGGTAKEHSVIIVLWMMVPEGVVVWHANYKLIEERGVESKLFLAMRCVRHS